MKIINESPDAITISGCNDISKQRICSAIEKLGIDDLDWDVKGSKFTIRLPKKTVIVVHGSSTVKTINCSTGNVMNVTITNSSSADSSSIADAIKKV